MILFLSTRYTVPVSNFRFPNMLNIKGADPDPDPVKYGIRFGLAGLRITNTVYRTGILLNRLTECCNYEYFEDKKYWFVNKLLNHNLHKND